MSRPQSRRASSSSDPLHQLRQHIAELLPQRGLGLIDSARRWSDRMLVLCAILMCWSASPTLLDRFTLARSCLIDLYPSRKRPGRGYGGFIDCLTRHGARLLALMMCSLRDAVTLRAAGEWRMHGFIVFGVDGTKIQVPRTDRNLETFGVANKKHAGPEMLLSCLFHLPTQALFCFAHDLAKGSERALLALMLPCLPKDSLIVADAGFVGWNTMKALIDAGHHFVIRAGANVKLIMQLGAHVQEREGIVYLWPARQQKKDVPPIMLRRLLIKDERGREMCLLTSVLDHQRLDDHALLRLYTLRWGVEVAYRWLKETMHGRKMLSTSPEHARVELDWTMIGFWMLTLLALSQGTIRAGLSLAKALRAVREAMTHRHSSSRRPSLAARFRDARRDDYTRRGSKTKRHWPRRSRVHRCGLPLARMASVDEIAKYQAILSTAA